MLISTMMAAALTMQPAPTLHAAQRREMAPQPVQASTDERAVRAVLAR